MMKKALALTIIIIAHSLTTCGQVMNKYSATLAMGDKLISFTRPDNWSLLLQKDSIVTLISFQEKGSIYSPPSINISSSKRRDVNSLDELKQVLINSRKWAEAKLICCSFHQDVASPYLETIFSVKNSKVNNVIQDIGFLYKGRVYLISLVTDKSQQEKHAAIPIEIFQSISLH